VTGILIPDPEVVAVAWARQNPDLTALFEELAPPGAPHPGSVSTRMPNAPVWPWVIASLIDGGPDPGEAIPLGMAMIQWDVYAGRLAADRFGADWASASAMARRLEAELRDAEEVALAIEGGGFLRSARVTSRPRKVPDPGGLGRFQLDSILAISI
jgi:hypothetical protein